jgi:hypothetical protein
MHLSAHKKNPRATRGFSPVPPTGMEQPAGNQAISESFGEGGAELCALIDAWPALPEKVRGAIMAMVNAALEK